MIRTKGLSPVPAREPAQRVVPVDTYVAGEIIADKYRLIQRLGEGGMGSVWVAKNLALDVQVAIKLLRTDVDAEGADERLLTEARATARLKHPNIVRVFDFGRTRRNDPFIVMELLQGESLGDVLDRESRLSATYAVQLLLPCVDALTAAHSKRIVHRDLKPDNIFLADSDGRMAPKVVDFGIAKFHHGAGDHKLTQAGTVLGSPDYMSPEQARGVHDIDHRADIWAICVVLYECITGRVPFENANYNALLRHIIEDDIPPTLDFAAGDVELWRILERGFAKRREERYQTMRELGEALAGWLMLHGITEDVCGHSLRATWLDAFPPGRNPEPSFSDLSSPRLPRLGSSDRFTATPIPISTLDPPAITEAPPLEPQPKKSRRALFALVAVLAVAVLAAAGLALSRGDPAPEPVATPTEEPAAVEPPPAPRADPPPKPDTEAKETAEPEPPASVSAPAPEPARPAPKRGAPAAQPPSPPAASSKPPPPKTKPKNQYEDLGF